MPCSISTLLILDNVQPSCMANTVLSRVNVVIPDHITEVEDINGRCDKVITHLMEQTIYKGRKRASIGNEQLKPQQQ